MATTKSIVTRIKNKVDTLAAWQSYTGTLLDGEIAIIRVATGETYLNPVTNQDEPVVELLMKVGDGSSPFAQLPWLSAKASDVYAWAKQPSASDVEIHVEGDSQIDATLGDMLSTITANMAQIAALNTNKLEDIAVSSSGSGVVKSIAKNGTGGIKATLGTVASGDIANDAVTNAKLADGAVKNAEVASDAAIDATKLYYATDKVTVAAKLATLSGDVAGLKGNVLSALTITPSTATANGVVQGIAYDNATGKFTVTYNTVATADIADNAVTTDKINNTAVTTAKIADGAVTNAKLGTDISSDKINVGTSETAGTLSAKIKAMDAEIASKMAIHDHPYAAAGHNHDSVYIKPADVDSKISTALGSVLKYKGTKTSTSDLPASGNNSTGDVWNITSKCAASGTLPAVNAGDNVAWNGTSWDVLAGTVDLSSYYNKSEVNSELTKKANATITATATDDDVVVLTGTAGNNGVSYSASHANSGVTAGTYKSVTVNAKGHVTAGTNPTTLAGFGISDAYTKSDVYTKSEVAAELDKKADTGHTHPSYANQNAFSNIKVGSTTVAADTTTDTVTFTGTNVTITPTASSDTINFAVADGTTSTKGIVQLSDATTVATGKTGSETAATTKAVADAMDAAEAADAKAAEALAAAGHSHPYASSSHAHGNITNSGTITSTAVDSATGVLVYDSNNKIQRATAAKARAIIGAGTSSLTIGTTASTAAAGNHTHATYASGISDLQSKAAHISTATVNSTSVNVLRNGNATNADILIFDCGGAWDL